MLSREDYKRGARNASWLIVGNYVSQGLSLLSVLVIARRLGPAGYGVISTATAFVALFSVFKLSGFDRLFIRDSAADASHEEGLYRQLTTLKLMASGAGVAVTCVAVQFTGLSGQERLAVVLFSSTLVTQGLGGLVNGVFQVREDMRWLTIGNLVRQGLYLLVAGVGLAWFVTGARGVLFTMAVLVASYWLLLALELTWVARYRRPALSFAWPRLTPEVWRAGLVFSASAVTVFLYTKVDILMARMFVDSEQVGVYAVCLNTVDRLVNPINVVIMVFFPAAVRRIHERGAADLRYLAKTVVGFGAFAGVIAVLGAVAGPLVLPALLGESFSAVVRPFAVLVWSLVPTVAMMPVVVALQASRHEDVMLRTTPFRAALNVGLDWAFLASGAGIVGVAWASVLTSFVFNAGFLAVAVRRLRSGVRHRGVDGA